MPEGRRVSVRRGSSPSLSPGASPPDPPSDAVSFAPSPKLEGSANALGTPQPCSRERASSNNGKQNSFDKCEVTFLHQMLSDNAKLSGAKKKFLYSESDNQVLGAESALHRKYNNLHNDQEVKARMRLLVELSRW